MGYVKAKEVFNELIKNGYINSNGKVIKDKGNGLNIIFLDIDGVLNCITTKDTCGPYRGIEDIKVSLLKEIVDSSNAKIVLVSSWKEWWFKEDRLKKEQDDLANYLDEKLAKEGLSIYDKTEDYDSIKRGEGIIEYLYKLNRRGIDVNNYVILDDLMFDYKKTKLTKHLVQTSFLYGGLQKKHVKKAIEILNK